MKKLLSIPLVLFALSCSKDSDDEVNYTGQYYFSKSMLYENGVLKNETVWPSNSCQSKTYYQINADNSVVTQGFSPKGNNGDCEATQKYQTQYNPSTKRIDDDEVQFNGNEMVLTWTFSSGGTVQKSVKYYKK